MTNENNVAAQAGDEPMRQAFETWAADKWFTAGANVTWHPACGEYDDREYQAAWEGYQAAQVSPRATAEVERVKLPHGHRDDFYLMANARGRAMNSIHTVRSMPNWVLAVKLFATGSTSAHEICNRAGIDPDGYRVKRATTKPGA